MICKLLDQMGAWVSKKSPVGLLQLQKSSWISAAPKPQHSLHIFFAKLSPAAQFFMCTQRSSIYKSLRCFLAVHLPRMEERIAEILCIQQMPPKNLTELCKNRWVLNQLGLWDSKFNLFHWNVHIFSITPHVVMANGAPFRNLVFAVPVAPATGRCRWKGATERQ